MARSAEMESNAETRAPLFLSKHSSKRANCEIFIPEKNPY